jgi:hypothetical protein
MTRQGAKMDHNATVNFRMPIDRHSIQLCRRLRRFLDRVILEPGVLHDVLSRLSSLAVPDLRSESDPDTGPRLLSRTRRSRHHTVKMISTRHPRVTSPVTLLLVTVFLNDFLEFLITGKDVSTLRNLNVVVTLVVGLVSNRERIKTTSAIMAPIQVATATPCRDSSHWMKSTNTGACCWIPSASSSAVDSFSLASRRAS